MNKTDLENALKISARSGLAINCNECCNALIKLASEYKTSFSVIAAYGFADEVAQIEYDLAELITKFFVLRKKLQKLEV